MPISDRKKHNQNYNHRHRQTRKRLAVIVEAGNAICWRCLKPIAAGSSWHVGHNGTDAYGRAMHATGPTGPTEHMRCNTQDGGRRGGHATAAKYFGKAPRVEVNQFGWPPGYTAQACDTTREW